MAEDEAEDEDEEEEEQFKDDDPLLQRTTGGGGGGTGSCNNLEEQEEEEQEEEEEPTAGVAVGAAQVSVVGRAGATAGPGSCTPRFFKRFSTLIGHTKIGVKNITFHPPINTI